MVKMFIFALLIVNAFYFAKADEEKVPEAESAAVEEPKKKRPKLPKRPIFSPLEAKKTAEKCECPIVVLLTLAGQKESSKMMSKYFARPELEKELILPNAVFFKYQVPQKKMPRSRRRQQDQKEQPVLPDMEAIKDDIKAMVIAAGGGNGFRPNSAFPTLAVVKSTGTVLGNITPAYDGSTPLKEIVSMMGNAFKAGGYELQVSSKMERIIEKDTKAREKSAKRAARNLR